MGPRRGRKQRVRAEAVDAVFVQRGGSCVAASYAVCGSYFGRGIDFGAFFAGYCHHFGLWPQSAREAESMYAQHFDAEWRRRNCRGYQLILDLHNHSPVSIFVAMRTLMRGMFYLESDPVFLEHELRTTESFLNVTYEKSSVEYHSITVFSDGRYLFARDTNRPNCYLLTKGLSEIGKLRDSVLYSRRK